MMIVIVNPWTSS